MLLYMIFQEDLTFSHANFKKLLKHMLGIKSPNRSVLHLRYSKSLIIPKFINYVHLRMFLFQSNTLSTTKNIARMFSSHLQNVGTF